MPDRRAIAIIGGVAASSAAIAFVLLRASFGHSSSVGTEVFKGSVEVELGELDQRSSNSSVSGDRVALSDGVWTRSALRPDPAAIEQDATSDLEPDSRLAWPAPGAAPEVQTYEEAMAALATILEAEEQLCQSALAEDPSARLRMVSHDDAVDLSRSGVLFLSGRSEELGGTGYFPANAAQAEVLGNLQASALELFWSEVYVDTASERLLEHFRATVGESGLLVRPREDGYGMEVVDGAGQVRASHLFHVPGYVL